MSYRTVYLFSSLCPIDGVGLDPPREIIGYRLDCDAADLLTYIFCLTLRWRLRVVILPD